jgi:hypothetical protein
LRYEARAQSRELAFGQIRKLAIQLKGHSTVDDAVAQEFEALIMDAAETAMGERPEQEVWVFELVSDRSGEAV